MTAPVGDDLAEALGGARREGDALAPCLQVEHGTAGFHDVGDGEGLGQQFVMAGLDLAHVEHGVDDRQEMRARLADQADIFLLAVGFEPAEIFAGQHIREAENGVERRAQLMADGGEEARLRLVGGAGFRDALGGLAAERLISGNVAQLGEDGGEFAVRVAQSRQFKAEMKELASLGGAVGPLDAHRRGSGPGTLAKRVEGMHECDAIGDVDEFGEALAAGLLQRGREALAVATAAFRHHAAAVEHEREARAGIEDQRFHGIRGGCGRRRADAGEGCRDERQEDGGDERRADRNGERGGQDEGKDGRRRERAGDRTENHHAQKIHVAHAAFARLPEAVKPAGGDPVDLRDRPSSDVCNCAHAIP